MGPAKKRVIIVLGLIICAAVGAKVALDLEKKQRERNSLFMSYYKVTPDIAIHPEIQLVGGYPAALVILSPPASDTAPERYFDFKNLASGTQFLVFGGGKPPEWTALLQN